MESRVGIVLALLVLTAGCNAFGATDDGDTATLTPAPVPTQSPTPANSGVDFAPGISASNVTNSGVLAGHHVAAINDSRYVWEQQYREDRRYRNVSSQVRSVQRVVVENDTVYRHTDSGHEKWIDGQVQHLSGYGEYANGDAKFTSWIGSSGEDRVFRQFDDPGDASRFADLAAGPIERYLAVESATVSRIDVRGSDRQHYLVNGTNTTQRALGGFAGTNRTLRAHAGVQNYTARAVVREDGFVRSLEVTYDVHTEDRDISVRYSFSYRKVGSATVTPPEWASAAREEFDDG